MHQFRIDLILLLLMFIQSVITTKVDYAKKLTPIKRLLHSQDEFITTHSSDNTHSKQQTVFDDNNDDHFIINNDNDDISRDADHNKVELEKRSRVEEPIRNFDDEGTFIVVDTDNSQGGNSDKKSDIQHEAEVFDDRGFTIVLNNNGKEDNEVKKDNIYHEMQSQYDEMERRFGSFIKHPKKQKRVRVIVITPKNSGESLGNERGEFQGSELANLDNLAEVSKGNIVLTERDGDSHAGGVKLVSDSARKTELEIDIDKLKHVKEKLRLLNEDEDNPLEEKNGVIKHVTASDKEANEEERSSPLADKSALQEAEQEIKTLNSYTRANKEGISASDDNQLHEQQEESLMEKLNSTDSSRRNNTESQNIKQSNITTAHEKGKASEEGHSATLLSHEVQFVPQKNTDSSKNVSNVDLNSANETNSKISEETLDSSDRKHEISKYVQKNQSKQSASKNQVADKFVIRFNEIKKKVMLPPGNPSPDNAQDLMAEAANESPTKSPSIKTMETTTEKLTSRAAVSDLASKKPVSELAVNKLDEQTKPQTESASKKKGVTSNDNNNNNKNNKNNKNNNNKDNDKNGHQGSQSLLPKVVDRRKAEAIIEFLNKDPLESWRYHFSTLKSLDLNSTILRSGLVNAGNIERLKGVMRRALEGKDITISIVGGSISAGGGLYKDRGNIDGLYYKGVVDWWNKMISPLTGSDMIINNIAIGSIGTDYFSYCVKNHISNDADIVLWELSANDFNRYKMQPTKGARPLERFTRMVLELPNKPALLYVNFFKGVDFKASRINCPNFEDQGEDIIAHYYKIPSLSWRAMVCGGLVRQQPGYDIGTLFSLDQYHPSLRGHAQMSLLLLLHLRHVMRAVLQWAISHDGHIERFEDQYSLPEPLFMGPKYPEPLCWTLITADISEKITNSLDVRLVKDDGFKLEYATNFPIRFDKVICWKAEKPSAEIALQFHIPENYGPTGLRRRRSEIAITTHTRWGGSSTMWIDNMKDRPIVIKEGRPDDPGKRTQVDTIANDLAPGLHVLNVRAHEGGFCLSSIMIDGS